MTTESLPARVDEPTLTPFEVVERVISTGDLGRMTPADRVAFYWRTCESLGLNPLTRPFEFIVLDGKVTLYARKDATDQLRRVNHVSVTSLRREFDNDDMLTVYAHVRDAHGREDESTGVVSLRGLSGNARANAIMKGETKAKRRATLSLVGLGFLDESEVDDTNAVSVDSSGTPVEPVSLVDQVTRQTEAYQAPTSIVPPLVAAVPIDDEPVEGVVTEVEPEPAPVTPKRQAKAKAEQVAANVAEPVVDEVAAPGMTLIEFSTRLTEAKLSREAVRETVKTMFPEATRFGDLTEQQMAQVWSAIAPVESPPLTEPMPVAESAKHSTVCGAPSPFSDAVCTLEDGHEGSHRASATETW